MQSKKDSLKEALINIAIGYCINVGCSIAVLPLILGKPVAFMDNVYYGLFMTLVSVGRQYLVRRWHVKKELIKCQIA